MDITKRLQVQPEAIRLLGTYEVSFEPLYATLCVASLFQRADAAQTYVQQKSDGAGSNLARVPAVMVAGREERVYGHRDV